MNLGPQGLALIERFEKCVLTAYQDGGGVWTIGWGHTGPEVRAGLVWTQAQADSQLFQDTAVAQHGVQIGLRIAVMQCEFDALCCLTYNIGVRAFLGSTLLRKLNAQDRAGAAQQFLVWDEVAGKPSAGLLARREAERDLFCSNP